MDFTVNLISQLQFETNIQVDTRNSGGGTGGGSTGGSFTCELTAPVTGQIWPNKTPLITLVET